ncbi:LysR family transcriptional regulator [Photobacterium chitinilyticum]|uniref:LysR family transcriptional regulator n=1 Tax=Photobacterium chitinilyticum TaxID=2485123 RepID=A0A444JN90_9GAMM|nr:LysR family transcriptional regulator [Photobacterium chitinilyticum]RWX54602.1 LysR family transcriptional regulator [Photobacterium chitinilyticum]
MRLKTTLDQWLTLHEINRAGSIQAAATQLNKSHTTLIYAIKKLEEQLGISLVHVKGRRAVLTDDGQSLLRRATSMLEQARELELISTQLSMGIESEITVSIDHLCCREWLYEPLAAFLAENKNTSVQVVETSLSSTTDAVLSEQSDVAIVTLPVTNHPADAFGVVTMVPVVAKSHPLALKSNLCLGDMTTETQIVIRDLGAHQTQNKQNVGWLKSQQRITVDNFDHAWRAVANGLGFCRLPEHMVDEMNCDDIVQLSVEGAQRYHVPLHIALPKGAKTGPAAHDLYELLLAKANTRLGYCQ